MPRKIIFYRTATDKCLVEDFLNSLPSKAVKKIAWVLRLIAQLEWVPAQYFCKLEGADDIWECRIKLGSNIYRIFSFWHGNKVILTHGIIKKSQKTPLSEMEKAQKYKKDYLHRRPQNDIDNT